MRTLRLHSRPNLTGAFNDEFIGRQFFQTHRAAGVQFVGADTDFRAHAEFRTVGEARRGVYINRRGIDLRKEGFFGVFVGGDDGIGVALAVRGARRRTP